ncbi:MAG: hypothetical protein IT381_23930 [Deltaproteobacteria bacterium]|nr:hypothetical protein [Deltaproteobacteria bacterium]
MSRFVLISCLALGLGALSQSCAGPCENLANLICDCEEDPVQRQSCRTQVTTDVGRIKFDKGDNDRCTQFLKTCDPQCRALRRGDRAACGFVSDREIAK